MLFATAKYTIHGHQRHFGWDNAIKSLVTVAPGDVVSFEVTDGSDGQLTTSSTIADVAAFDPLRANPLSGPIRVDGAAPGDAISIEFLACTPAPWGWTALIPGRGLLAEQFTEPALRIWKHEGGPGGYTAYGRMARVPLRPFVGTIGLAPAQPGYHAVRPPRRVGGNMDARDLTEGSVLHLPVEVAGGLMSVGDAHAAQGDGEVCGTAIETSARVALRVGLVKDARLKMPRFDTPGAVTRHIDRDGYHVTTGIGPDILEAARIAVGEMIELLARRHQLPAEDAYMLCSACADLRLSEIVNFPNMMVSLYFPRSVFN